MTVDYLRRELILFPPSTRSYKDKDDYRQNLTAVVVPIRCGRDTSAKIGLPEYLAKESNGHHAVMAARHT